MPFPVLKDFDHKVADAFGAKRTPEAFLLDAKRVIRYHGRIDDQYGIGFRREKPTRRDLQGSPRRAAGRQGGHDAEDRGAGLPHRAARRSRASRAKVTYAKHVAPILQKRCQECHRPGEIGPISLLTYDDAKKLGRHASARRSSSSACRPGTPTRARQVRQRPPADRGGARHAAGLDRAGLPEGRRQGPAAAA